MTNAELSYKMCPSSPPMKCLTGRPCPFHLGKQCHVADGAHHQKSVQMINNPEMTVRKYTLATQIYIGKRR